MTKEYDLECLGWEILHISGLILAYILKFCLKLYDDVLMSYRLSCFMSFNKSVPTVSHIHELV